MKKLILFIIFIFSQKLLATPACIDKDSIYKYCADQMKYFESLVAKAGKENKILFLTFGADWCPWCQSMHKTTHEVGFTKKLAALPVLLANIPVSRKIDGQKHPVDSGKAVFTKIAEDSKTVGTKIDGIPYLVFYNPKTHKAIFKDTGGLEASGEAVAHDTEKVFSLIEASVKTLK